MLHKKKILFVINSLGCGGAEKSLVSLLSLFDYETYDVYLQMFHQDGMFMELLPETVNVLSKIDFLEFCNGKSENLKKTQQIRYFVTRVRLFFGLRINKKRKIRLHDAQVYWKTCRCAIDRMEEVFDVAIAWGQGNPTHYAIDKVKAEKKIAFINTDYKAAGHNPAYDSKYYEQYNYIIAVSEKLRERLKEVFPEFEKKIKVIYDISSAKLIQQMAMQDNPYREVRTDKTLVTVGRLVEAKGYDIALSACKILKDKDMRFKWYVVGEGPERERLETDIIKFGLEDNMILVGAQINPYPYIKNADIYVQTSKFEGYCLTISEARMLNRPIVTTNFEVVYNQIRNQENGLIVEMNGQAVASGIEQLLMDENLCAYFIKNLQKEKKGNEEEIRKLYSILEA